MKILNTQAQKLLLATLGLSAVMLPTTVTSAPGNLASQPIFTQNAINPNIILGIDDSGSMDSEVLMQTNDGAFWWNTSEETFVGFLGQPGSSTGSGVATPGLPNFNINGSANSRWKKYTYLFPNGTGTGNRVYNDSTNAHFAIPPVIQYAFMRSPDYNSAFFDPAVTYKPWVSYTTKTFADIADETMAPSDPFRGSDTFDLTDETTESTSSNFTFKMYKGMVIPENTRYNDGSGWQTAASDTTLTTADDVGISYNPSIYYRKSTVGTYTIINDSAGTENGDCSTTPSPAHYQFFEKRPSSLVQVTGTVDALGPDGACLVGTNLRTAGSTAEKQNFANWFSYYRKRHLAMRAGVSLAFQNITGVFTGLFTINNRVNVTMLDFDTQSDSFYSTLYDFVGSGGTPNRTAMDHAGLQYKRTDTNAPVIAECQKNFTIFFTDGFSTTGGPTVNSDNDNGVPYADNINNTLADIAMNYYENTLVGSFPAGKVPVSSQCDEPTPDAKLDCNTDLHMVTYTVGLGAKGTIFNNPALTPIYTKVADVYDNPVTWPNVNAARDPRQIDDLYHAAVNGRGEMLNAATPALLEEKMKEALTSITEQTGSAASVAFNTSVLSTGSVVYQARFNTDKWKGELLSIALDPVTGNVAAIPTWDAADEIPAHGDRIVYTYNPDNTKNLGVLFEASTNTNLSDTNLPAVAISDMTTNLPTVSGLNPELTEKDLVNYLRGDRTYEGPEPATGKSRFRTRHKDTVLGDIVHSAPLFVGDPSLNWPTGDGTTGSFPASPNDYETWSASISRTPMVYVGANDGMFHGFDATSGEELLAYIPSILYSNAANEGLHHLADPGYQHRYYVDNTASRSDAYIKGRNADGSSSSRDWRSIIVGSLRGGGKGVFALDVNNPSNFAGTADSAAETVLWEFDSSDDDDLGLTFSRPTIVPTNATSGGAIRWAAIFGNGYNDGGDCRAKLFVLFLDGGLDGTWTVGEGNDYLEFDTEVGTTGDCNGLSTPAVVDLNADGKADGVYAGDLHGNMWSFDLCNKDNMGVCQETGWDVTYSSGGGGSAVPAPLFSAKDAGGNRQQITAAPIVISHPTVLSGGLAPNVLVLFGTGQYLVDGDKDDPATTRHSYYGIWDRGDDSLLRDRLLAQIFETGFGAGADFRITGTDIPDYTNSNANNREYGWYLDLPDTSEADNSATGAPERVVTRSVVIGDVVFFNTLVPTTNGCDIGGYGYLMSVETKNGGRPEDSIIDVNIDGSIDDSDFQDVGGQNAAVTGKKTDQGILSEPTFLGDKRYESTSKGDILKDDVDPGGVSDTGRFSWTELRCDYPHYQSGQLLCQ